MHKFNYLFYRNAKILFGVHQEIHKCNKNKYILITFTLFQMNTRKTLEGVNLHMF
jgi:hypothetical protein